MPGKRSRKGKDARRQAHLDRIAAATGEGDRAASRRDRAREQAGRTAAVGPSAARWLVRGDGDSATPVDVVADLLALDPRTRLRGRGDGDLRVLAGAVEGLVTVGATTPSGRPLVDVMVADADLRDELAPQFDLAALLDGGPVSDRVHDRTVRLAEALLARATEHRNGQVDLYGLAAPVGLDRHPQADGIETLAAVAVEGQALPGCPEPAILTTSGGWLAVSPVEAFLAAARGLLVDASQDVVGAGLYAWMQAARVDPSDGWWVALSLIADVDAVSLLDQAAARAGADHPDVAGGVLAEMIGLQHPR